MTLRFASLAMLATAVLPLAAHAAPGDKPLFLAPKSLPASMLPQQAKGAKPIAQFNGSFTDMLGDKINYTMIGGDPTSTNKSTTIKVVVVPVKLVFNKATGGMTFDPLKHKWPNGLNEVDLLKASPLISDAVDWKQGGTDLGQTQYLDAYQRGNFWSTVKNEPNYHILLDIAKVAPEETINITSTATGQVVDNPFGHTKIGEYNYGSMQGFINSYLQNSKNKKYVKPNQLVFFITYQTYLRNPCCIGGYHTSIGNQPNGQTFGYTTMLDDPGAFSQDVSAAAHELGEWLDDPFTDNYVNCQDNGIMENGDPLESGSNYGGMPIKLDGFTYNPQELVFIDYFGAPKSGVVNQWLSFANTKQSVCPGQ
jgi:hypothetical protein